jgi:hypothetical protein
MHEKRAGDVGPRPLPGKESDNSQGAVALFSRTEPAWTSIPSPSPRPSPGGRGRSSCVTWPCVFCDEWIARWLQTAVRGSHGRWRLRQSRGRG